MPKPILPSSTLPESQNQTNRCTWGTPPQTHSDSFALIETNFGCRDFFPTEGYFFGGFVFRMDFFLWFLVPCLALLLCSFAPLLFCFFAFLLFCFFAFCLSASLLHCFSVFLFFCFSASLLLWFCAFCFSVFLVFFQDPCFSASLLLHLFLSSTCFQCACCVVYTPWISHSTQHLACDNRCFQCALGEALKFKLAQFSANSCLFTLLSCPDKLEISMCMHMHPQKYCYLYVHVLPLDNPWSYPKKP